MTSTDTRPVVSTIVSGRTGWQLGRTGQLIRPRYLVATAVILVLMATFVVVSVTTGTLTIPAGRLVPALLGLGEPAENLIMAKRGSRSLLGLLVGFALGVAGGITQSLVRNPLASPDILGVTSGASLFAVAVILTPLTGVAASVAIPAAAVLGAFAAAAVVVGLAWRGGLQPMRLVLVGIGITAICTAGTQWMLMQDDIDNAAIAVRWLSGSLEGASWDDAWLLLPVCLVSLAAITALARPLAAMRLGPDLARGLGVSARRSTVLALVLALVLVAAAAAVAGPIGFVAFVAPQVALRVFGTAGPPVFAAGMCGALIVVGADLLARVLPVALPAGVITSMVGGLFLLTLLFRYVRRTSA